MPNDLISATEAANRIMAALGCDEGAAAKQLLSVLRSEKLDLWGTKEGGVGIVEKVPQGVFMRDDVRFDFAKNRLVINAPYPEKLLNGLSPMQAREVLARHNTKISDSLADWAGLRFHSSAIDKLCSAGGSKPRAKKPAELQNKLIAYFEKTSVLPAVISKDLRYRLKDDLSLLSVPTFNTVSEALKVVREKRQISK